VVATGVYQSWRQLGSWSAFTDTRYGQLLLVKIGLVALLVGIAWTSRRWTARLAVPAATEAGVRTSASKASAAGRSAAGKSVRGKERVPAAAAGGSGEAAGAASGDTGSVEGHKPAKGSKGSKDSHYPKAPEDSQDSKDSKDSTGKNKKGSGGGERAAQLARQRAAVDAARQKRLRNADDDRFGLRRSVLAETGVAVVLLAVTTVLTSTEPGRTEQDAARAARSSSSSASAADSASGALTLDMPFDTGGADGKGVVSVDLDPARAGANEMHVYVTRPNGRAFDVPEVKVAFTLEAKSIGPLPVAPDHITTGHWSANGVQIPMAGEWKIAVTVRTSDIDQVTVSKNAQIG